MSGESQHPSDADPADAGSSVPMPPPSGPPPQPAAAGAVATGTGAVAVSPPGWSAWQGLLGLFAWVIGTFLVGTVVLLIAAAFGLATLSDRDMPPGVLMAATAAGDIVFIAVPLAFAAITARPRAWHFGLRRTRFWPTVGWAALAIFLWFIFNVLYEAIVNPPGRQTTADDLGVNRSAVLLVVGGFVIVVLAPIVEEFFFRGFVYRTLRNGLAKKVGVRAGVLLAAVLNGALFGLVHATNTPLAALPVLATLGFAFCLVLERTGSLFAIIALHAIVNTLGYLVAAENSAAVALGFGALMLLGCMIVPRFLRSGPEADGATVPAPAPS